jgi:hypothetical protein
MRTIILRSLQSLAAMGAIALLTGANDPGCGDVTLASSRLVTPASDATDTTPGEACEDGMVKALVCEDGTVTYLDAHGELPTRGGHRGGGGDHQGPCDGDHNGGDGGGHDGPKPPPSPPPGSGSGSPPKPPPPPGSGSGSPPKPPPPGGGHGHHHGSGGEIPANCSVQCVAAPEPPTTPATTPDTAG